ncbi:MAG: siderophore-interacting protein, partial [Acidobacteria bacterium]|nr:siderophore-interacting protein [Acidobacteriota bacterium]
MPAPQHSSTVELASRLKVTARSCLVASRTQLSPSLVEVTLRGDATELAGVAGNDVMVLVASDDALIRRRYSVRHVDPAADTFSLWISLTHDGPAARWARSATVGDALDVIGPRGKIYLDERADWHLFVGDVSSLGAFYRLAQSIETPGRAIFIVEIDDPADALTADFAEELGVTAIFVDRNARAHDDAAGLLSGLAAFTLPSDEGHAYLFGEFHVMRALKSALLDQG